MIRRDVSPECGDPGIYTAEVKDVEVKTSRSGSLMLVMHFIDPRNGGQLCDDIIMLEGPGRDMGKGKLSIFGIPPDKDEFDETQIIGKRVRLGLKVETYNGISRLKVDIATPEMKLGYGPVTEPEPAKMEGDDVPF